jgi:hypothetical protein
MPSLKKIPLCLLAAFCLHWLLGMAFKNSLVLHRYDPVLQKSVMLPGSTHQHTSEGIAVTTSYAHSIVGYEHIDANASCIAIFGDSYVESFQVSDSFKMGDIVTQECAERYHNGIIGLNIGASGRSIADYYHDIPKYEQLYHVMYIVILLGSMDDVLPDSAASQYDRFVSEPDFSFVKSDRAPRFETFKNTLAAFRLDFLWGILRDGLMQRRWDFPFLYQSKAASQTPPPATGLRDTAFYTRAWDYLLTHLKRQTSKPILFVYCPTIPSISGNAVSYKDPDQSLASAFAAACREHGLTFLNLGDAFIASYVRSGTLPRGFSNSRPGFGHLNESGHRIAAEAILDELTRVGIIP